MKGRKSSSIKVKDETERVKGGDEIENVNILEKRLIGEFRESDGQAEKASK